jgi:HK97 family phage major capsid protein
MAADGVAELLEEVRKTRDQLARADTERLAKIEQKASRDELERLAADMAGKTLQLQRAVDTLSLRLNRPSAGALGGDFSPGAERAAARGLLELKHMLRVPKADFAHPFRPSEDDLTEAEIACKAMRHVLKLSGGIEGLDGVERKALSSFMLGSSGWLLPPEWSQTILSCLEQKTDLTGLVTNLTTTGSSLKMSCNNCPSCAWPPRRIAPASSSARDRRFRPTSPEALPARSRWPGRTSRKRVRFGAT